MRLELLRLVSSSTCLLSSSPLHGEKHIWLRKYWPMKTCEYLDNIDGTYLTVTIEHQFTFMQSALINISNVGVIRALVKI